jgi:hypothetical protein
MSYVRELISIHMQNDSHESHDREINVMEKHMLWLTFLLLFILEWNKLNHEEHTPKEK